MNLCLIYKITNTVNGKVYIGQTWNTLNWRFNQHCAKRQDRVSLINKAILKYGKDNFIKEILTVSSTQECADYWERYFITRYNTMNNLYGYNLTDGGSRGRQSPTSRYKISIAHKGKPAPWKRIPMSEKIKQKLSAANKGKPSPKKGVPMSEEQKNKLSVILKGRPAHNKCDPKLVSSIIELFKSGLSTGEVGKELSIDRHTVRYYLTKNGITDINKRPRISKEQKQNISRANKGKIKPEGFGAKISEALTGTKLSEERKQKISTTLTGRKNKPHSEETKAKMRAKALERKRSKNGVFI